MPYEKSAKSRKVAGSIHDGIIRIFDIILRPHYGPGFDTFSNRNVYQEYFLAGTGGRAYSWQPYHLHVAVVLKSGSLKLLESSGPVQACTVIALPFRYYTNKFLILYAARFQTD